MRAATVIPPIIRSSPAEKLKYIAAGRSGSPGAAPPTNRQLLSLKQTWGLMLCRFWVGPVVRIIATAGRHGPVESATRWTAVKAA